MPTHDHTHPRPAADDRVSMADASVLASRDRKTLMKDIADGRLPNASQQAGGRRAWTLLVQDLLDAGLVRAEQVEPPRLRGAQVRPGQRHLVTGSAAHPRRVEIASLSEDDPRRIAAMRVGAESDPSCPLPDSTLQGPA